MKKRLLCIAAAVLMVLAAVFAFGCEKQFPSAKFSVLLLLLSQKPV